MEAQRRMDARTAAQAADVREAAGLAAAGRDERTERQLGEDTEPRGRSPVRTPSLRRSHSLLGPSSRAARRRRDRDLARAVSPGRATGLRAEGEPWASRTEEEGSLIIACCDSTVKFFEVWAGKSKGHALGGKGLGTAAGVLGGSRVLEGWCEGIGELRDAAEGQIR